MNVLHVGHRDGDVRIREDELVTVTQADLRMLGISRKELLRCFAAGVELMRNEPPGRLCRPVADQRRDGSWEVNCVGYARKR